MGLHHLEIFYYAAAAPVARQLKILKTSVVSALYTVVRSDFVEIANSFFKNILYI